MYNVLVPDRVPSETGPYIRRDTAGVLRVGPTRVRLASLVFEFNRGESPEAIRQNFDVFTLEQVYGALTYYLSRRDEVDSELREQAAKAAEWEERSRSENKSLLDELSRRAEQVNA